MTTAASLTLFPLLAGPLRSARVLAIVPGVVYLHLDPVDAADPAAAPVSRTAPGADGIDRAAAVLALLEPDAVRLPFGLVLPPEAADLRPVMVAGTPVSRGTISVGWGALRLAGQRLPVLDWWNPAVPTLALPPAALPMSAQPQGEDGVRLPALPAELAAGLSALASGDAERAVHLLIGVGDGRTPAGDGVLCGALAALACWAPESAARRELTLLVAAAAPRSTPISVALLQSAAGGAVIGQLRVLLAAIGSDGLDPGRPAVSLAIDQLAGVATVSGAAMAAGAVYQYRLLTQARAAA